MRLKRKIACVACLDESRSIHTRTFRRAIELFQELVADDTIELSLYDDSAEALQAARIAQTIVANQPDCVVGHFLSDAAHAAAPFYAEAGIPLLLPAATRSDLTQFATTYRVCDSETDYVRWLSAQMAALGWHPRHLICDDTLHAKGLSAQLAEQWPLDCDLGNCQVVIGRYDHCLRVVRAALASGQGLPPTLLTDDAASEQLCRDLVALPVALHQHQLLVAALCAQPVGELAEQIRLRYEQQYAEQPGSYFWETVAALQLASVAEFPHTRPVTTVLGCVRFNRQRELALGQFALLQCEADGFIERLVEPGLRPLAAGPADVAELAPEFRNVLSARRLMLRQRNDAAQDYGRAASARWAASFSGELANGVQQRRVGAQVTEFFPGQDSHLPALFYLHGGGMVHYDVCVFAPFLSHMASTLNCRVVAFDYDKLPEHTAQDSIDALLARIEQQLSQCRQPPRLAGDSVGGLLALFAASERFAQRFSELILLYPVLALNQQYPSYQRFGQKFLLDAEQMRWFLSLLRSYFNQHHFDPLQLTDAQRRSLPSIRLFSAGCDVLSDEADVFVARNQSPDQVLTHHRFASLPHDFCLYHGKLLCVQQAVKQIFTELT